MIRSRSAEEAPEHELARAGAEAVDVASRQDDAGRTVRERRDRVDGQAVPAEACQRRHHPPPEERSDGERIENQPEPPCGARVPEGGSLEKLVWDRGGDAQVHQQVHGVPGLVAPAAAHRDQGGARDDEEEPESDLRGDHKPAELPERGGLLKDGPPVVLRAHHGDDARVDEHQDHHGLAQARMSGGGAVVADRPLDVGGARDQRDLHQHQDGGDDAREAPGRVDPVERGGRQQRAVGDRERDPHGADQVDRGLEPVTPPRARRLTAGVRRETHRASGDGRTLTRRPDGVSVPAS